MTNGKPFTMVAAAIFMLMALVHAYRLVTHFQVVLGSHVIGLNLSWVAIAVALLLSWGLFREARR
jgi:hypothetical protein